MNAGIRTTRVTLLALIAAVGASSVATVAWANHHASVVHVCKHKNTGNARIVSAPDDCRPSETHQELAAGSGAALEAYARIEDGALDAGRSKNVAGITATTSTRDDVAVVVYCFDLTFVPRNAVGSGELEPGAIGAEIVWTAVAGTDAMAALACPAGTDAAAVYSLPDHPAADSFYARFTT